MTKYEFPKISIVIPTLGRSKLEECIKSIRYNYYPNYEIITSDIKGLCKARNDGLNRAKGKIVIFTDDDVLVSSKYLFKIARTFDDIQVGGVTGPTIIPKELRSGRDLLKFHNNSIINKIYNYIVLENQPYSYARQFKSGGFGLGSTFEEALKLPYSFECDWLEACNMAYRKEAIMNIDGFDETYGGCGDYSEPDLAFKVKAMGYKLIYNPKAYVTHYISQERGDIVDTYTRQKNFMRFHKKWFKWNWRYGVNQLFINGYFITKALQERNTKWLGGVKATMGF